MTELEWLDSRNPLEMLSFLNSRAGRGKVRKLLTKEQCERKLRLFLVACCRRIWPLITDERSRKAVEVVERYVDGKANQAELKAVQEAAKAAYSFLRKTPNATAFCAACAPSEVARLDLDCRKGFDICTYGAEVAAMAPAARLGEIEGVPIYDHIVQTQEEAMQADFLRDVFGSPFRSISLDPTWLCTTVTKVAQAIYAERRFEDLPILADALEEAGCNETDIVFHCRKEKPHVRGCWVVDLILKRE